MILARRHFSGWETTDIDKKITQALSHFSYIGIFFGVAIALGLWAGSYLDRHWHTDPWMKMLGALFGISSGFYELVRISKQAMAETKADEKDKT